MNLAKYYSKIRQDIAITTFYSGMSGMIPVLKAVINNTQAKLLLFTDNLSVWKKTRV